MAEEIQTPHNAAGAPAATTSRTVLVVDDNADAADTLVMLLEMMGHTARAAHDGRSAIEQVGSFAPDIVLLDIGLPDMSGYDVARRIREQGSKARLIALTGWGQAEDRQKSQAAGFDEHWTKPVDPEVLNTL